MQTPNWAEQAACKGAPLALFITVGDDDDDPFYPPPEANAFCNVCPVKHLCLEYALEHGEKGVWGGTTTYQRSQLSRVRERRKCPGCDSSDLVIEGNVELCLSCGVSWYIV